MTFNSFVINIIGVLLFIIACFYTGFIVGRCSVDKCECEYNYECQWLYEDDENNILNGNISGYDAAKKGTEELIQKNK